jgi:hypothetical protein
VGLVALGFLVWTLYRTRRGTPLSDPLTAAALALLLISLNADLLHQRYVWLWSALLDAPRHATQAHATASFGARASEHQVLEARGLFDARRGVRLAFARRAVGLLMLFGFLHLGLTSQ